MSDVDDAIKTAFRKAADLVRKKAKSFLSWGYDPSATEDTGARDESRGLVVEALNEVAAALEEAVDG